MKEYNIYYHHVVIRAAVCVASRCCRAAAPTITQNRFVGVAAMNVQRTGGAFRRTTNNREFRVSGRRAFPSTRSKPDCHYSDFPDTFYPRNAGRSENRIPPQTAPQTTAGRTADHHRTAQDTPQNTLQDAENNFISFQTWFHVKIKH